MLILADPTTWSVDFQSGLPRYAMAFGAGVRSATLSMDGPDALPEIIEVQSQALVEEPVVRRLPGSVVVSLKVSCPQRSFGTIVLDRRPSRMTIRLSNHDQGMGWARMLPAAISHPRPLRPVSAPLDLDMLAAMLARDEVDKALDEVIALWGEATGAERSAATILLFEYLAGHPLKRTVVLGALMASLCHFRALQ